jgi:hypothetical protein
MEKDLPYLIALKPLIFEIAVGFDLNPRVIAAIMSRESGGGRLLRGKRGERMTAGQKFFMGTGDRGHGRGLMQVDDRYWKGALNLNMRGAEETAWAWAPFNIALGCFILKDAFDYANRMLKGRPPDLIDMAAVCMYNTGPDAVTVAMNNGDPNSRTHNHDYGTDVMRRMLWLANRTEWNEADPS